MAQDSNRPMADPYADARLARDMTGLAQQLERRAGRQPGFAEDPGMAVVVERLDKAIHVLIGGPS